MPKQSISLVMLPNTVQVQLRLLGENLSIARKRRREPMRVWAQRIGVSEPTLMRLEKGDPSVSMGAYATALWLMGRGQALGELAAPEHDLGALDAAVRAAQARAVRRKSKPTISSPATLTTPPDAGSPP